MASRGGTVCDNGLHLPRSRQGNQIQWESELTTVIEANHVVIHNSGGDIHIAVAAPQLHPVQMVAVTFTPREMPVAFFEGRQSIII